MSNYGTKVASPSLGYLISGAGKNILVDTGPGPQDLMERLHPGLALDFVKGGVVSALAGVGLTPDRIDSVIFTHLHWDHCHNGEKFPGKRFFVQRAELIYALLPLDIHANLYEAPKAGLTPPWFRIAAQLEVVEGDTDIDDGIRLVFTPGHSPGSQSVLVNTEAGPYLIAGDTVMQYENWEGKGFQKHLFSLVHVNLTDFDASLRKIETLGAVRLLPGHDFKALEHEVYPLPEEIERKEGEDSQNRGARP
ncbi:MAG: N-acyl homoserine lactonase family protein [Clostridiales Family XIII bacterium]|nr:N-acyl homoserine lactonase family protein [Clostridiales Family XIII bacterium]